MPFVDDVLRHDSFLDELWWKVFRRFKDKNGNYWWQDFNAEVEKVDLYRISFEKGLFVQDGQGGWKKPQATREGQICVTRHAIFRRWDGELLAFAQSTGSHKINTSDLPDTHEEIVAYFVQFYLDMVNYTSIYSYTLERYDGYTHFKNIDGTPAPVTIMTDDYGLGVFRTSMDVEFYGEHEYYEDMKQSPIIQLNLKGDTGSHIASIGKLNYRTNTNWWDDSLIQLKGFFDETSVYFTLKVDSAPVWEDNLVVTVPFFFGNLETKATKPPLGTTTDLGRGVNPVAMFGGTQVDKFFDFDSIETMSETLQPLTRNYISFPSNGVDSVMIKKTKYGARYQAHYLSWNAPSNLMPPTREELRITKEEFEQLPRKLEGNCTGGTVKDYNRDDTLIEIRHFHADWNSKSDHIVVDSNGMFEVMPIKGYSKTEEGNTLIEVERGVNAIDIPQDTLIDFYSGIGNVKRKYPRAWNYLRKGYYDYQFHPSRYSEKVHTSRIYVAHPEDGVLGYLPNLVSLPLININEGDKLRYKVDCLDCDEEKYIPEIPTAPTGVLGWNPGNSGGGNAGGNPGGGTNPTPTKAITYSATVFKEPSANDGSISNSITGTLSGDTFTGNNGDDFVAGGKVTVTNVPSGLTATVVKDSDTKVTISLTGQAISHTDADDISNLNIKFNNNAFAGNDASTITNSSKDFSVDFTDGSVAPNTGDFGYMCDGSVQASNVNTDYWSVADPNAQAYINNALGRQLDSKFWQGREDFLEMFGTSSDQDGTYTFTSSSINPSEDFYAFLWKAIEDVKAGTLKNESDWVTFDTWASQDLSCLTDLQRASLWLSTKIKKPVLFFQSASGYLQGDTLDIMAPMLEKVPTVCYDWIDFNNVYVENQQAQGVVGAFVKEFTLYPVSGPQTNFLPEFKSMVNFEPQALNYPYSALKAHKPFDYVKPNSGFGSAVVGGEYTNYYVGNVDQTNYLPYVVSEVAIHEMAHALSNYGEDVLGTRLHDMPDWLSISWEVDSNGEWDGQQCVKSNPGTVLDNGKLAPVSDYGCFQPAEDFAEAFMCYVINRDFLRDNFQEKHDFIRDKLQAMGIDPNL